MHYNIIFGNGVIFPPQGTEPLSIDDCEVINHCLFLLRSLLFLNDTELIPTEKQRMHQQLLL